MTKAHLTLITPSIVNRTVTPQRRPNVALRTREHLTEAEVQLLMDAARKNRWGHRDATMVLVAYRHGFRRCTSFGFDRTIAPAFDRPLTIVPSHVAAPGTTWIIINPRQFSLIAPWQEWTVLSPQPCLGSD